MFESVLALFWSSADGFAAVNLLCKCLERCATLWQVWVHFISHRNATWWALSSTHHAVKSQPDGGEPTSHGKEALQHTHTHTHTHTEHACRHTAHTSCWNVHVGDCQWSICSAGVTLSLSTTLRRSRTLRYQRVQIYSFTELPLKAVCILVHQKH